MKNKIVKNSNSKGSDSSLPMKEEVYYQTKTLGLCFNTDVFYLIRTGDFNQLDSSVIGFIKDLNEIEDEDTGAEEED